MLPLGPALNPALNATGSDTTRWLTNGSQLTPPRDCGRGTGNPDDNPGSLPNVCKNASDINKLGRIISPSVTGVYGWDPGPVDAPPVSG